MKAFAKDKDKLRMRVMTRQLLKFMDTSGNGAISLDEFQAFDWAHVLDRIKDALALERREMAGKLAGTRYELTGNTDYTSINDSVTAFAHREEEWSGIIEIAEDGKILMPDLSLRYKPKGSSNRGDGFIDTEKSMIDRDGVMTLVVKQTGQKSQTTLFKGEIVCYAEFGRDFTVEGTCEKVPQRKKGDGDDASEKEDKPDGWMRFDFKERKQK